MNQVLKLAANEIDNRTRSGIDADGKPFAPYNPQYAAAKASGQARKTPTKKRGSMFKAARRAKSGRHKNSGGSRSKKVVYGPTQKVDLNLWGNMLANISTEVLLKKNVIIGRIFFPSSKQADKARGIMQGRFFGKKIPGKARKFFALSSKQRTSIRGKLKRRYKNLLKGK